MREEKCVSLPEIIEKGDPKSSKFEFLEKTPLTSYRHDKLFCSHPRWLKKPAWGEARSSKPHFGG